MKMKMKFREDLALKIVSVLIAVALWFYVVQAQSPDIERTIKGVPVVFTQKSVLEDRGLILLNDQEHTVDIKIRGTRKSTVGVSSSNITVAADVSSIEEPGQHSIRMTVVLPYSNLEVINQQSLFINVDVDHLATLEKDIEVKTLGTPKTDFVTGTVTSTQSTVQLKGPKTILDGVSSLVAELDVSGKDTDVETIVPLKIYGTNGKEIQSAYITSDVEETEVRCEILKTKLVNVTPVLDGYQSINDSAYRLDTSSLQQIRIAGAKDLIDALSSIHTKPIAISDIQDNGEAAAELDLPAGIRSLDGNSFTLRFVGPEVTQLAPSASPVN